MKKTILKFSSIAALAAGMAFAQTTAAPQANAPARHARPGAAMRQRMFQALNLTDAQKQQAKTLFQQAKQNAEPVRAQLKQNREALTAAIKANDSAQIHQLATQQGVLEGQMLAIRADARAKFYQALTPDQRAKADQMQQKFHQRMKARFGQNG